MVVMVRRLALPVALFTASLAIAAEPVDLETNKWLRTWIPVHCCVTNNCCFPVKATALEPQPGDNWKVLATGQVLARTNWSPDGKYWRCACDNIGGKWVVHEQANTRCIFPAMQSVMARPATFSLKY
jgi:hypothetical protein